MTVTETGSEDVDWITVAQDRESWLAVGTR